MALENYFKAFLKILHIHLFSNKIKKDLILYQIILHVY